MRLHDRNRILIAWLVVTVCVSAAWGALAGDRLTGSYWYAVDHITGVQEDGQITLWVVLPPERPEQKIEITAIVPEPVAILEDTRNGNRVVEWSTVPTPGLKPVIELYRIEFLLDEIPLAFEFEPDEIQPYDRTAPEFATYTQPEVWIQTDGEILDQARQIVGDETNPWRQALSLYDWTMAELTFVPGGVGDRDAKSTLRGRRGDCGQFSALYCALCRSIGIPARTVTNVWTEGGAHVSAEVFLQGIGWVPMDTSLGQMLIPGTSEMTPAEIAEFMDAIGVPLGDPRWPAGNLCNNRLITSVGNNIRIDSPTLGRVVEFQQMNPGGSAAHPTAIEIHGLNRDLIHGGFHVFGRQLRDEEEAHQLTHQRLANLFFREGLYDVVEGACRKTHEKYAGGIQSWINEGKVSMHKHDYYAAEAAFKRALRGVATNRKEKLESVIWTHNYLGNCYDLMGHREMALQEYQAVIDQDNNYRGAMDYARKYLKKPFSKKPDEGR